MSDKIVFLISLSLYSGALYDNIQSFDAIYYFASACFCMASIVSIGIIYMQLKKKFKE